MGTSYWESFKEQNKDMWHFDPKQKTQDFTHIGTLKTNFQPLLDLMKDDKNLRKKLLRLKMTNGKIIPLLTKKHSNLENGVITNTTLQF